MLHLLMLCVLLSSDWFPFPDGFLAFLEVPKNSQLTFHPFVKVCGWNNNIDASKCIEKYKLLKKFCREAQNSNAYTALINVKSLP